MNTILLILFAAVAPSSECVRFRGDAILASDVAAVFPPFAMLEPDTPVARAPSPGSLRILSARDLRHASLAHPEFLIPDSFQACFQWQMQTLRKEDLMPLMLKAFDDLPARIEIVDFGPKSVPPGRLSFSRSTLMPPASTGRENLTTWRGYVEYAPSRREPIWARVRVMVPVQRVVATSDVKAGEEITAAQVQLQIAEEFPTGSQTRVERLEEVVGKSLRRSVKAGTPIPRMQLTSPTVVEKGETVELRVLSGKMHLKLDALAETSGVQGGFILLRNSENGKLIRARVESRGQAILDLTKPGPSQGDR